MIHCYVYFQVRVYQCKKCKVSFGYKSQLKAHLRAHEEMSVKFYQCNYCFHRGDCGKVFLDHIRDKHNIIITQKMDCFCKNCQAKTEEENKISDVSHLVIKEQFLQCEKCDFVSTSSNSLQSHMKRHRNDEHAKKKPLEQYKCKLCGYVCAYLPSLKSHMWKHANDQNYDYLTATETLNDATQDNIDEPKFPLSSLVAYRCCRCGFECEDRKDIDDHMDGHFEGEQTDLVSNFTNKSLSYAH